MSTSCSSRSFVSWWTCYNNNSTKLLLWRIRYTIFKVIDVQITVSDPQRIQLTATPKSFFHELKLKLWNQSKYYKKYFKSNNKFYWSFSLSSAAASDDWWNTTFNWKETTPVEHLQFSFHHFLLYRFWHLHLTSTPLKHVLFEKSSFGAFALKPFSTLLAVRRFQIFSVAREKIQQGVVVFLL